MPETVNGLPAHVLLVHAVVVLVPLCALLLVAAAVLPPVRARLGVALPGLAALCVLLVPVTVRAGEQLRSRLGGGGELVAVHARLAERLLPWVVGVLVMSVVVWWRGRGAAPVLVPAVPRQTAWRTSRGVPQRTPDRTAGAAHPGVLVSGAVAALCLAVAAGTVVQVVRVGESGSRAVWTGVGSR